MQSEEQFIKRREAEAEEWANQSVHKEVQWQIVRALEDVLQDEDDYFTEDTNKKEIGLKVLLLLQKRYLSWQQLKPNLCKRGIKKWDAIIDRVYYRFKDVNKLNKWFEKERQLDYVEFLAGKTEKRQKTEEEFDQPKEMIPRQQETKHLESTIVNNESETEATH